MCVCVRACVHTWVRSWVRVYANACVRACVRASGRTCMRVCSIFPYIRPTGAPPVEGTSQSSVARFLHCFCKPPSMGHLLNLTMLSLYDQVLLENSNNRKKSFPKEVVSIDRWRESPPPNAPRSSRSNRLNNARNDPRSYSESWVWQKKNESRTDAMEMRSLRNVCGIFLKNRCMNRVRERFGLKENVVTRIEKGVVRRFRHLERMNESRLTKQIYRANVCDGKVGEGRPRKSYANQIGSM
ncbi:hypothetical protein EVAR_57962_1 [Eumeta japonica]|uniref:Uncharacterized protein n=1 Tax=Eumeta variegata TaxID=151549 RepID=A0A4C1XWL5_EUMVA|nr:hypothetical protein EVAR_57962_1 [Eumeta japonica]